MELSREFWEKTAFEMSLAERASEVVEDINRKLGIAKTTIYRNAKKFGFSSGRKRRKDAGRLTR
jgi:transcriptional regulator of acetoin/glycerol metabolism